MKYFPVTNSDLSATHLGHFLQKKYSIGKVKKSRLIKAGINDTYLIETEDGKFILRIYSLNWRTKKEIEEEIKLLNLLRQHAISVSHPLQDKEKNYIYEFNAPEGKRYGVLFTYAPGEKIHVIPEEVHFEIGKLMARFHKITAGLQLERVTYTPEILLKNPLKEIRKFLSGDCDEMKFLKKTQKILLKELLNANHSKIRKGIVHLDIWFDNLNLYKNNKITIFDFDFCGNGWLCMDIAYYILQLHNVEKYEEKDYAPKIKSFLKGYESVIKLTGEEKRMIPLLGVSMYYFYLGIQCGRYHNWSNSFLNENYLKRFINGLVKRYFEIYNTGIA